MDIEDLLYYDDLFKNIGNLSEQEWKRIFVWNGINILVTALYCFSMFRALKVGSVCLQVPVLTWTLVFEHDHLRAWKSPADLNLQHWFINLTMDFCNRWVGLSWLHSWVLCRYNDDCIVQLIFHDEPRALSFAPIWSIYPTVLQILWILAMPDANACFCLAGSLGRDGHHTSLDCINGWVLTQWNFPSALSNTVMTA